MVSRVQGEKVSVNQVCSDISQLMQKVEEAALLAKKEEEEGVKRQSKRKDHYMVELEQGKFADLLMTGGGGRSSVSSGYNSLSQAGDSEYGDTFLGRPPPSTPPYYTYLIGTYYPLYLYVSSFGKTFCCPPVYFLIRHLSMVR